jgi:hypothetical protein
VAAALPEPLVALVGGRPRCMALAFHAVIQHTVELEREHPGAGLAVATVACRAIRLWLHLWRQAHPVDLSGAINPALN